MTTYKISVGNYTAKQKYILLQEIFINSENTKDEIQSAYYKKYSGFDVKVSEIKEIEIYKEEIKEVKKDENKSSISLSGGTEHSNKRYHAEINLSDIEEWEEWIKPVNEKKSEIHEIEIEIRKKIEKKYHLRNMDNFKINYADISFSFYPCWFNFNNK